MRQKVFLVAVIDPGTEREEVFEFELVRSVPEQSAVDVLAKVPDLFAEKVEVTATAAED